jgi:hypothetical protein
VKTDEICEHYASERVDLTMRLLDEEDGSKPSMVLIEGSAVALKMVAELLIAVADEKENDGFSMSPFGAGNAFFSEGAKLGIYIYRIDD